MPELYYPWQRSPATRSIAVAVRMPPSLIAAVRESVEELDRTQPVYRFQSLEQLLADSVAPRRFNMFLLQVYAAAAAFMALAGTFGVVARSVARRTRETAVRIAVGARPAAVARLIIRQAMVYVLLGLGAGIIATLALGRVMRGLLHGVEPNDPATVALDVGRPRRRCADRLRDPGGTGGARRSGRRAPPGLNEPASEPRRPTGRQWVDRALFRRRYGPPQASRDVVSPRASMATSLAIARVRPAGVFMLLVRKASAKRFARPGSGMSAAPANRRRWPPGNPPAPSSSVAAPHRRVGRSPPADGFREVDLPLAGRLASACAAVRSAM